MIFVSLQEFKMKELKVVLERNTVCTNSNSRLFKVNKLVFFFFLLKILGQTI